MADTDNMVVVMIPYDIINNNVVTSTPAYNISVVDVYPLTSPVILPRRKNKIAPKIFKIHGMKTPITNPSPPVRISFGLLSKVLYLFDASGCSIVTSRGLDESSSVVLLPSIGKAINI